MVWLADKDDRCARIKKLIDPRDGCRVGRNYGKRNVGSLNDEMSTIAVGIGYNEYARDLILQIA